LCGLSKTDEEIRLLVRDVITVQEQHIVENNNKQIHYTYESYLPIIKKAVNANECFVLVHSHPNDCIGYSKIDDIEEKKLLKYAYQRIKNGIHGSLVFNNEKLFEGRIYNPVNDDYEPITKIRVIGETYKFLKSHKFPYNINDLNIFNRNVLAFGEDLQKILSELHVGIVGCGGTGSAVIEQLCRMGIGELTLVDFDNFEDSNITRMHGSSIKDVNIPKVKVMEQMIKNIGLNTKVNAINERVTNINGILKLRNCDLIFSCIDNTHFARALLSLLSLYYYIPIIDTGIKFDCRDNELIEIYGRIDVITPNVSCLYCRGQIDGEICASEVMNGEEYRQLLEEGYAKVIENDKVQTISYNTLIASYAVCDMIQLLTNFKGENKYHTIYRFIANKVSDGGISGEIKKNDCMCNDKEICGKGDIKPFLGVKW